MVIDGRIIKEELQSVLRARVEAIPPEDRPTLYVVVAGANSVIQNFVVIKKRFAASVGIPVREYVFEDANATTESLLAAIAEIAREGKKGGIVVQLPLPLRVDTAAVLNGIPLRHDVDVLGVEAARLFEEGTLPILPPVVGAIREILERNSVFLSGKKVAVVGKGRLVGAPAAAWFRRVGATVTAFDVYNPPTARELRQADIIVLGIGKPGFLTPDMVKDGAVVLDAGASEEAGKIVGDAEPKVAEKCALFTPVPGGIGPVTVAVLFQNLLTLQQNR